MYLSELYGRIGQQLKENGDAEIQGYVGMNKQKVAVSFAFETTECDFKDTEKAYILGVE